MIKLSSFDLFSNFLNITQEFTEDLVRIKIKSLVNEHIAEIKYEEIAEITYVNRVNSRQMSFGFGLLAIVGFSFAFPLATISARSLLFLAMQFLYALSTLLFLTSFIKNRFYYFSDKNQKPLTYVKVTNGNHKTIINAIELIEIKSGTLRENAFDNPFPNSMHLFEIVEHDFPNYFNKSITRFYEDELIVFNKSIFSESVSNCRYSQLSEKVYRGKEGNHSWDSVFWILLAFSGITAGAYSAFHFPSRITFLSILAILVILLVVSFILRYVKQEIIGFYNKDNQIVYWSWVNRKNKEKFGNIIEFIQSKISHTIEK